MAATISSCSNFLLISPYCNYKPTNKLITSKKTHLALPNSNSIFLDLKSHTTVGVFSTTPPPPLMKELNEAQLLNLINPVLLPATSIALPFFFLLHPQDALAVGGELGILEGRSFALLHPLVMAFLFFYTCWAGYLGWQWRRVRTTQNEINELKKQVPSGNPGAEGGELAAAALTISTVESKIQQLTEERKELIKGSFRDRHFNAGSILLAFGVIESVGGCLNTYFRTGKLFPGPHLFSGAAITVLWALAAALVPAMQKGNETARSLHIALNALNVVLFIWQIPTGIDIVYKVFEFTKWP